MFIGELIVSDVNVTSCLTGLQEMFFDVVYFPFRLSLDTALNPACADMARWCRWCLELVAILQLPPLHSRSVL